MKKSKAALLVAATVVCSVMFSSCIGSFSLTKKLYTWNNGVGDKFVNELVFLACNIIPVYPVCVGVDAIVLNTIEFWTGSSPMAATTTEIETENGVYIVEADQTGYTITNEKAEASVRFNYNEETQTWSVASEAGEMDILTFVGENQVIMANSNEVVDLTEAGVMAYKAEAMSTLYTASK